MKCNHKYVAMEDGTNDLFCVRCRKFAMQAVASLRPPAIKIRHDIVSGMSEGLAKGLTANPSSIGGAINSAQSDEFSAYFKKISKLLREEMEKDMMKATRSRGVF